MQCIVDGSRGIYVPKNFAERFNGWNVRPEDVEILLAGPDHADYWETWDDVLRYASYTDDSGRRFTLWQDGDLFAVADLR